MKPLTLAGVLVGQYVFRNGPPGLKQYFADLVAELR